MEICYFAVKDKNYPRARMITSYLTDDRRAKVHHIIINHHLGFVSNALTLIAVILKNKKRYDAVILAEFSLQFAILAWIFARKKRAVLVVDWFVGLHETRVGDYGMHSPFSIRAVAFKIADGLAANLADIAITDTLPRAKMIKGMYHLSSIPLVVPVGAPKWAQYTPVKRSETKRLRILYYGNYIPLHGLNHVVKGILKTHGIGIDMTLIGNGSERASIEEIVHAKRGPDHVFTFIDPVDEIELLGYIAAHDVVVGVFGSSPKAKSVIANKVWQGLACGKRVITQKTSALDGIRDKFVGTLYEVEASSDAISIALQAISAEPVPNESSAAKSARIVSDLVAEGLSAFYCELCTMVKERVS